MAKRTPPYMNCIGAMLIMRLLYYMQAASALRTVSSYKDALISQPLSRTIESLGRTTPPSSTLTKIPSSGIMHWPTL